MPARATTEYRSSPLSRFKHRCSVWLRLLVVTTGLWAAAPAQAVEQMDAWWAVWVNSFLISDRLSLISDIQLRSYDDWSEVKNVLIRPGLSYALNKHLSLGIGYALVETNNLETEDLTEHRIWEQVLAQFDWGSARWTQRFRLEQRFIELVGNGSFEAERFRYFFRVLQPFSGAVGKAFVKGPYFALQNEVFVNLTDQDRLSGSAFDQNRAYFGLGWRFSKMLDMEVGYMNRYTQTQGEDVLDHILQAAVYTRL